jgi:predicted XRE-type DNA-binding protein
VVGSGDTKVEQSSGNVFKDVGFSDTEAERALLKADLALEIYNIIESQKLTQAQAGKILGIDPSDISRLKAGDFNRFSVERLFTLLNRFNRNIEIRITRAEDREGHQRVVAV